jgi:hypothetical protein
LLFKLLGAFLLPISDIIGFLNDLLDFLANRIGTGLGNLVKILFKESDDKRSITERILSWLEELWDGIVDIFKKRFLSIGLFFEQLQLELESRVLKVMENFLSMGLTWLVPKELQNESKLKKLIKQIDEDIKKIKTLREQISNSRSEEVSQVQQKVTQSNQTTKIININGGLKVDIYETENPRSTAKIFLDELENFVSFQEKELLTNV